LEADESEATEKTRSSLRVVQHVTKAAAAFRNIAAAGGSGPSDVEIARGVQVETIYDFYDPATRATRVRKMNDEVLHRRKTHQKGTWTPADIDDQDAFSPDGSEVGHEKSSASETSDASDDTTDSDGKRRFGHPCLRRQFTRSNPEVITTWAALIGKLMHSKILDFTALKDKAIRTKSAKLTPVVGAALSRMTLRLRGRARMVLQQTVAMAKKIAKQEDRFDSQWRAALLSTLFTTEYIDTLMLMAHCAQKLLAAQPPLVHARAPCKIFGDIHGQLRDLLLIFHAFGAPMEDDAENTHWVFNGDFVDRGLHQVEVIGVLLSLKVLLPDRVWLVRGNHEDRSMNERYGFQDACTRDLGGEFGPKVFELIQCVFDRLPVACVVAEKILCVHGGIGDGTWKLDDLRTIPRPLSGDVVTSQSWIFNILWSDPIEDGKDADPLVFGVHESPRGGVAAQFAWNITKTFCARNGLSLVVRSHQSKRGSRGFDVMHENMLVRVFSARDYEGHGNDGSVLKVAYRDVEDQKLLVVRPQVVRSVKKMRDEEVKRREENGPSIPSFVSPRGTAKAKAKPEGSNSPRIDAIASPRSSRRATSGTSDDMNRRKSSEQEAPTRRATTGSSEDMNRRRSSEGDAQPTRSIGSARGRGARSGGETRR